MSGTWSNSGTSDQLLPGRGGHVPSYGTRDARLSSSGITGSTRTTISFVPDEEQAGGKERVWVVARCALIACLATLVGGMNGGFSSSTLLELQNPDLTTPAQHFSNTSTLPNLFGALGTIGAMFGGVVAWPISDHFGRQTALVVGGVPFLCGWLLIANAIQVTHSRAGFLTLLFSGRLLAGFATGWSVFCVSVYIAEISSPRLKGIFGNCNQLFTTLGILITYFLGIKFGDFQFHYSDVALVGAGFVALFEILMLTTYETPRWLFGKDSDYNGIRVLKILRGQQFQIAKEIDSIKAILRHVYTAREQLLEFKNQAVYRPFILVIFLMFFQQFSGINAAIYYASQIFLDAGYNSEKANLVSFGAVGCVQVLATLVSVVLVDYLGRRILLITSSIGMILSSFLLGIYFFLFDGMCQKSLESQHCPHHIEYLAIGSVIVYIISFSLGWGPIPWSSMSELLPNRVRTLGGSIATLANWGFATIIIFAFPVYSDLVSPKFTWWTFGIVMGFSVVFVALFIPEAKGQSLEEIQEHFESGGVFVCSCHCQSKEIRLEDASSFTSSQTLSKSGQSLSKSSQTLSKRSSSIN